MAKKHITIYDNGGETVDRYSVFIGNDVWDLSEDANLPNGVCLYAGDRRGFLLPAKWHFPAKKIKRADMAEGARIALDGILRDEYAKETE